MLAMNKPSHSIITETIKGYKERRIWLRLAKMAIDTQYKQNTLGPLWIAANTGILVVAFSVVYSHILKVELDQHIVYVASGLILWYFYSSILLKSCTVFLANRQLILQLPLPVSLHIFKLVFQELLTFAYNLLVVVLVCLIFMQSIDVKGFVLAVLAFLFISINAYFAAFVLAIIATRYRDVTSTVQALITPMMFLTPIIWSEDSLSERPAFISYNPFFHLIEIWRSPILGTPVPYESWVFVTLLTVFVLVVCGVLFARYNKRIAFWL